VAIAGALRRRRLTEEVLVHVATVNGEGALEEKFQGICLARRKAEVAQSGDDV
jgi:hypothetical protein